MLTYGYDASSNITSRFNWLTNATLGYTRDDLNRISRRDVNLPGGNVWDIYGYDSLSRLTTIDREDGLRDTFGYDWSSQMVSALYGETGRLVNYTLDKAGNRTQGVDAGVTKAYTTNTLNQYTNTDGQLMPVGNGAAHEITSFAGVNFTYINDERLVTATNPTNTYQLGYDAFGRTVKRTLNTSATAVSVIVHGISVTPLMTWYHGRQKART